MYACFSLPRNELLSIMRSLHDLYGVQTCDLDRTFAMQVHSSSVVVQGCRPDESMLRVCWPLAEKQRGIDIPIEIAFDPNAIAEVLRTFVGERIRVEVKVRDDRGELIFGDSPDYVILHCNRGRMDLLHLPTDSQAGVTVGAVYSGAVYELQSIGSNLAPVCAQAPQPHATQYQKHAVVQGDYVYATNGRQLHGYCYPTLRAFIPSGASAVVLAGLTNQYRVISKTHVQFGIGGVTLIDDQKRQVGTRYLWTFGSGATVRLEVLSAPVSEEIDIFGFAPDLTAHPTTELPQRVDTGNMIGIRRVRIWEDVVRRARAIRRDVVTLHWSPTGFVATAMSTKGAVSYAFAAGIQRNSRQLSWRVDVVQMADALNVFVGKETVQVWCPAADQPLVMTTGTRSPRRPFGEAFAVISHRVHPYEES